jgi:hypothetical protein
LTALPSLLGLSFYGEAIQVLYRFLYFKSCRKYSESLKGMYDIEGMQFEIVWYQLRIVLNYETIVVDKKKR